MRNILTLLLLSIPVMLTAQKKIIDHQAYKIWKRISSIQLNETGSHMVYVNKPLEGDGYFYLVNLKTGRRDSFLRASDPQFTSDHKTLLFTINPGYDTLRNCELKKVKKDKWPKDSLGIYLLENDSLIKIPKAKEVYVAEAEGWYAWLSHDNKMPVDKTTDKKKKKKKKKKKQEEPEIESEGKLLTLQKAGSNKPYRAINTDLIKFSQKCDKAVYISSWSSDELDTVEMVVLDLKNDFKELLRVKHPSISDCNFNHAGTQLVYTATNDTIEEGKVYRLHLADLSKGTQELLIDSLHPAFSNKLAVSNYKEPYFSFDDRYIFFGLRDKPEKEVKDTLLESEKAKLDIWHWKDDRLQPQQLVELRRDSKKTWLSRIDLNQKQILQLENDSLRISHDHQQKSHFAVGYNRKPYEIAYQWAVPSRSDVYRVDLETGESTLLVKGDGFGINLAPSGQVYTWYNEKDKQTYLSPVGNQQQAECITCSEKVEWLDDVNGMPMPADPLGVIAWMKPEQGKTESKLLIQSKYNIYQYDASAKQLKSMTGSKQEQMRYRIINFEPDSSYLEASSIALTGFNEKDKSMALYRVETTGNDWKLIEKHHSDHDLGNVQKARKGDQIIFQLNSQKDYPDVHHTSWQANGETKQLSWTNPQQADYNWATVELIDWKSYSGIPLQGLLYKPEDFDPTKKYPLLVYFYEMYSDELHNHYAPRPTASIIYPTEYASAGYMVLIPDIRYQAGHPAQGAYDCIMSGTDAVLKKYPCADSSRMGLQGQSWGGYQTAQLVTMTTRYKAAMAGAPVSNMFSAYGGIRWGSGLNRQFQYEHTQSRIGKTIWEAPDLYVENSPLFHLPKVQTPLLIMANDQDGAVPWYQGIELFTGLRRLSKPVWMLNYNGDDHNLTKAANKMDLSIRMRQFFDHYLLDKPAPRWLDEGLPAVQKGKEYRLDYKQ